MIATSSKTMSLSAARHAPLSVEEEAAVLILLRRGGKVGEAARHKLVNANLKFVVAVARKFTTSVVPIEDLINEGAAGLVKATHMYNPASGKFLSYAVWWIRQSILKYLHDHAHTIRIPSPSTLKTKLEMAELKDKKRGDECRESVNEAQRHVEAIHRLRSPRSMDLMLEVGWEPVAEDTDPAAGLETRDSHRRAFRALEGLKTREREIVQAYYGFGSGQGMTLEEVGERFGLTRERVRQIKQRAVLRMRSGAARGRF